MIHAQNDKAVVLLGPGAAIATTATATARIDTLGFEYLSVDVVLDTTSAATDNPSVLKFTEGDDTNASTAITELTGDGASGFTIPDNSTSAATIARFRIDLRKRKRYLKLSVTPIAAGGQKIEALARLGRANEAPDTASEAGASAVVTV